MQLCGAPITGRSTRFAQPGSDRISDFAQRAAFGDHRDRAQQRFEEAAIATAVEDLPVAMLIDATQ